jgi:hypothetical protein
MSLFRIDLLKKMQEGQGLLRGEHHAVRWTVIALHSHMESSGGRTDVEAAILPNK